MLLVGVLQRRPRAQVYQSQPLAAVQWFIDAGASVTQSDTADLFQHRLEHRQRVVNILPDPQQPFYAAGGSSTTAVSTRPTSIIAQNSQADPDQRRLRCRRHRPRTACSSSRSTPGCALYATAGVGLGCRRLELDAEQLLLQLILAAGPGFGHDTLVAASDSTHFAWNAGAGIEFPVAERAVLVHRSALRTHRDPGADRVHSDPFRLPLLKHAAFCSTRRAALQRAAANLRHARSTCCACTLVVPGSWLASGGPRQLFSCSYVNTDRMCTEFLRRPR